METPTTDVSTGSSPAIEVPRDPKDYAKWRETGEIPESKPKADPTPAQNLPAEGEKPEGKAAPASEPGKSIQDKKPPRSSADTRLNEILDDLRKAGLTPLELKTFKREIRQAEQAVEPPKAATEPTEKPTELKPPTKPKLGDFPKWEDFEAAQEKYLEDLAEFKAAKKIEEYRQQEAQNAVQQSVRQKMEEARGRYGDEAVATISQTAKAITGDQQIAPAVRAILDQSPVWPDVLYTLGSNSEEFQGFLELARTNPGAAIRKAVIVEQLVTEELAKGGKSKAKTEEPPRGEDGKFATPDKRQSAAPPPPHEVSGRGTAPADAVQGAVNNGNVGQYMRLKNAEEMTKRRGR